MDLSVVDLLPAERRANYRLDLAEAHRQSGDPQKATAALLEAERTAPDEVRCRPSSHRLISSLAGTRFGRESVQLRQLAVRAGVPA